MSAQPSRSPWRRLVPAAVLLVVGMSQMFGDLAGMPTLKGAASATMLAPAPRVFSTVKGLETFSTRFGLSWEDRLGQPRRLDITQERYVHLRGPYQRRNTYGAALAYGPVLVTSEAGRPLMASTARFGLCGDAPLLDELGVPAWQRGDRYTIHYQPRPGLTLTEVPDRIEITCP